MRLHVDHEADALYFRLDESPIVESEEVSPGIILDFSAANAVVGIEIMHLSRRASPADLSRLVFETAPAS